MRAIKQSFCALKMISWLDVWRREAAATHGGLLLTLFLKNMHNKSVLYHQLTLLSQFVLKGDRAVQPFQSVVQYIWPSESHLH